MSAREQTDLNQWDGAVASAARMFSLLAEADINLRMVNIGGGFPARYRSECRRSEQYAGRVTAALTKHFGNHVPEIIVEPGRSLVGDAGIIQSEVVLISDKGDGGGKRWVYLDVASSTASAETMGRKHQIPDRGARSRAAPSGPVVIAARPADSARHPLREDRNTGCRSGSSRRPRSRSCRPAPIRRATPRSASTASRRCGPTASEFFVIPAKAGTQGQANGTVALDPPYAGRRSWWAASDLLHQLLQHRLGKLSMSSATRQNPAGPPITFSR